MQNSPIYSQKIALKIFWNFFEKPLTNQKNCDIINIVVRGKHKTLKTEWQK